MAHCFKRDVLSSVLKTRKMHVEFMQGRPMENSDPCNSQKAEQDELRFRHLDVQPSDKHVPLLWQFFCLCFQDPHNHAYNTEDYSGSWGSLL